MTAFKKAALTAMIATGTLAFASAGASAAIACRGDVCWHVHESYHYPAGARIVIHEDRWHPRGHIVFREHEGRGYWRDGAWVRW